MKKKIEFVLFFIIFITGTVVAQSKNNRFCTVIIGSKNSFTTKKTAKISFGEIDSLFFFRGSTILLQLKKVNTLSTTADVLNYMSSLGWSLVSAMPYGPYTVFEELYFQKEFTASDL